ncbi:soluble hydrogenase 42 kDa subunit [Variibacter gotjawalensis]|uniref:Soluble hydrogenase 42 kDa subunit n=1 Tax=Variibacter gotjawalensis TaxID=1333996 RepID=A0A0S3PRI6_9BRAD|nr:aminotransferase class V-fold PLP-dependent enzyme [Variibacter gotjawalensis]NIK48822.1 alanine-glyoxylate transaminase/serine-glyoxylate transaminase/serine-pyruvate transaminase [Variibacter gotjawalensis]RZS50682.1 alanine-glyoxylate transaminase/serine-glyoxylate transaminase/serine-pyruvate transaminase [Variibacter gotjawalensis]BAT58516.1 soluble hydrogenase 42 kDa subunit [Variibacter gotjawalensis]
MSLRSGREFLSIPGPTVIPDQVLASMQRPAVDIYSGPMIALTDGLLADMSKMFRTKGRSYIYIGNGHAAWEGALTNVLSRGDKVLVLESGRFAIGWGEAAKMLGADVEILPGSFRAAVKPEAVESRLKADTKGEIKAILVAQIDTASGVVNDIKAISDARRAAGHDALLMVDTVASLGCMPFEMDAWGVDVAMSGAQKGLMTPPGLSFVAGNARARAIHPKADMRSPYWDWTAREGELHYHKYNGTPPEHLLFALRTALDMIFAEGFENVFRRHSLLAEATRRAVSLWSEGQDLGFNIIEPAERSDTVTTILMREGLSPEALTQFCNEQLGVVLGVGIGALSGKGFRIAHMGHVNAPMILGTLSVVELALSALKMPHGKGGVQAAVDYLASEIAA